MLKNEHKSSEYEAYEYIALLQASTFDGTNGCNYLAIYLKDGLAKIRCNLRQDEVSDTTMLYGSSIANRK